MRTPSRPRPPEAGDRSWMLGRELCSLASLVWFHSGDVPFFQEHCPPPILHPIGLQWLECAESALKNNSHFSSSLYPYDDPYARPADIQL